MVNITVVGDSIRFTVEPRDVPAKKAARRLHLTERQFLGMREELFARGFPRPDATTGHYDLAAIDTWMDARHEPPPQERPQAGNDNSEEAINAKGIVDRWRRTRLAAPSRQAA